MTTLTPTDFRLLQRALALAASYADSESDEEAILELSERIALAHKTVPGSADAHAAVTATVDAIKKAAAGAPGGAVQNPDKIVKMQMAQGAK